MLGKAQNLNALKERKDILDVLTLDCFIRAAPETERKSSIGNRRLGRHRLKAAFVWLKEQSGAAPWGAQSLTVNHISPHGSCYLQVARLPQLQELERKNHKETFLGFRGIHFPTNNRVNKKKS